MKLSCLFSSMEEKRIINPPLFMGFSEGRDTTFGAVRTETCLHSLCRVVTKEDRMSMAVQEGLFHPILELYWVVKQS